MTNLTTVRGCDGPEFVNYALSKIGKDSQSIHGILSAQNTWGQSVKDYIKRRAWFASELRVGPSPAEHFHLILHRVPARNANADLPLARRKTEYLNSSNGAAYVDADRVFAVGKLCQGANARVATLIRVPSRIWLLRSNALPQFIWDQLFADLYVFEPSPEVSGVARPRVVPILDRFVDGEAGRKDTLIETVPHIVERVGEVAFHRVGKRVDHFDLLNKIAGSQLLLHDNMQILGYEEGLKDFVSFGPSKFFSCDELFGCSNARKSTIYDFSDESRTL